MTERWLPVVGWEHRYEVSDMGRVRSYDMLCGARGNALALRNGRMLVQVPKQGRYLAVTFAEGARREQWLVHIVVLTTFVGPCPEGMQALHRDGDKGNNALSNLRWGTPKENAEDRIAHGNSGKGEKHPRAKLSETEAQYIRWSKEAPKELAVRFNITPDHVSAIRAGKTWKHLDA